MKRFMLEVAGLACVLIVVGGAQRLLPHKKMKPAPHVVVPRAEVEAIDGRRRLILRTGGEWK